MYSHNYAPIDEAWAATMTLQKSALRCDIADDACKIYSRPFQIAEEEPSEPYNKNEFEVHNRTKVSKKAIIEKGAKLFEAYEEPEHSPKCSIDEEIDKYLEKKLDTESDKKQFMNFMLFVIIGALFIIVLDLFFRMGQYSARVATS